MNHANRWGSPVRRTWAQLRQSVDPVKVAGPVTPTLPPLPPLPCTHLLVPLEDQPVETLKLVWVQLATRDKGRGLMVLALAQATVSWGREGGAGQGGGRRGGRSEGGRGGGEKGRGREMKERRAMGGKG